MKIKLLYPLAVFAMIFASCEKEKEIDLSDFSVKTESSTFKVGEQITFKFNGNAPQISFFSGEAGNSYDFKDSARIDNIAKLFFSFENHNAAVPVVNVKLLVSTDFDGVYEYPNVTSATWTDISSRFHLAEPGPYPGSWEFSNVVDIANAIKKGKPLYFAFKYVAPAFPSGTIPSRNYRTRKHVLEAETKFGYQSSVANYTGMGWNLVKKDNMVTSGSVVASSIMLFSPSSSYRDEYEEWGVSKGFELGDVNLGVDRSVPIKVYADATLSEYVHTYTKPGTYTATFVGTNKTLYNTQEKVKQITITITP